ncbi:MAG TPA: 2-C-methyl-D-erythritol 4-phosphate cytidylyltransferase [Cyclobacteriaceae bacterium]|nr:2-C-methyl-D-erythritol 4-phosphate cytidylyltransferase [Cyclobacteriaceae bacterium]
MKKYAIIVAGGSGLRMGAALPKQYLPIGGKPILMHTLSAFYQYASDMEIKLVIPEADFGYWKGLCKEFQFILPHTLVRGGKSRFQSVKNGLDAIEGAEGLVAIHDGVRPFVAQRTISESFLLAEQSGSAVSAIPLKDSLRKTDAAGGSSFQDRDAFRLVQTPQTFQLHRIKKAFEVEEILQFTDDATVYEYQGWEVNLIEGDLSNIKITTPEDMAYAEYLLQRGA